MFMLNQNFFSYKTTELQFLSDSFPKYEIKTRKQMQNTSLNSNIIDLKIVDAFRWLQTSQAPNV